jgi:XTP/dITP diphosphohydrolase
VTLYASTHNPGKLREFLRACEQSAISNFTIQPLPGLKSIAPPDETGETFEENAALKAIYYSQFCDSCVFADDSGLEVPALGGAPGVRSARYAGEAATDAENNALLLRNLEGSADRAARFVCFIALARRGKLLHAVRGTVDGEILTEERGTNGFGYDPLFFYPPFERSFGEIGEDEKFAVSHRGQALRSLFDWISRSPAKPASPFVG